MQSSICWDIDLHVLFGLHALSGANFRRIYSYVLQTARNRYTCLSKWALEDEPKYQCFPAALRDANGTPTQPKVMWAVFLLQKPIGELQVIIVPVYRFRYIGNPGFDSHPGSQVS
jgi:hypothetical protein